MKYFLLTLALILVSCSGNGTSADETATECTLTYVEFEDRPDGDIRAIVTKGSSFDAKTSLAEMCTVISSWDETSDKDTDYCVIKQIYQEDVCDK